MLVASIKSPLADGMYDECANCELDIRTVTERSYRVFELGKLDCASARNYEFACDENMKHRFARRDRLS